jgi:heme exporter protein D
MMPDLGRYALWVLGAYGATLALIGALIALTLWRAARVRAALRQVEDRASAARGTRDV